MLAGNRVTSVRDVEQVPPHGMESWFEGTDLHVRQDAASLPSLQASPGLW